MSFETAVQTVIYTALSGNVTAPVFDAVPQQQAYPYVTIGDDNHVEWDTDTDSGATVSVTIHVWSQGRGRAETKRIQGLIYDILHDAALTIAGFVIVSSYFESSVSFMDSDGKTRHGVQTFRIIIEKV